MRLTDWWWGECVSVTGPRILVTFPAGRWSGTPRISIRWHGKHLGYLTPALVGDRTKVLYRRTRCKSFERRWMRMTCSDSMLRVTSRIQALLSGLILRFSAGSGVCCTSLGCFLLRSCPGSNMHCAPSLSFIEYARKTGKCSGSARRCSTCRLAKGPMQRNAAEGGGVVMLLYKLTETGY